MASGHDLTWGGMILPQDFHTIDPHVAFDVVFTSGMLVILAIIGGAKFRAGKMDEPSGKLDLATFFEILVGGVFNFTKGFLHDKAKPLFFLTGTLAFFILTNNLIGLVPGFNPPTDQFNVTIVLGVIVFIVSHIMGFQAHGIAYLKHFMGPVWWLAWLLTPIELVSHMVRPLSLALRLFGNITGDHKVGGVFFGLIPLLVPVIFGGLGLFVGFVQTFVFLLLSLVYIQMSMAHDH